MIEIKMPEEEEMPPNNHSREKALIKLQVDAYNFGYEDGVEAYKAMMELEREEKEEAKSEQEPKTGKWERFVDDYDKCSICGMIAKFYRNYNYCPNCGAKMAESEENA